MDLGPATTPGVFGLVLLLLAACGPTPPPPDDLPPVRALDHVYVPTAEARELAALLRDSLGLPEVWPFASRGGTGSAGFSLGNLVLEVLERADAEEVGIEGVALWPTRDTETAVAQLRLGGLGTGRSVRVPSTDGSGWVVTGLGDFPEGNVFLCEYREADAVQAGRQRAAAALEADGGGALGLRGVLEVVVTARDAGTQRRRWRALAVAAREAPAETTPDGVTAAQAFTAGPAVRIQRGDRGAVTGMVLVVRDVVRARAVWPEALAGLGVSFVPEAPRADPR